MSAVRQAQDFDTWRAIGVCVVGWFIYVLTGMLLVGLVIGGRALF